MRRSYPRPRSSTLKISLVQGSYRVSMVTQIDAARLGVKLWHIRPNSHNRNLIERAWKVMNDQVRDNAYFLEEKVFASTIKDLFLNHWSKLAKSLTPRFADSFQIIQKPAS